MKILRLRQRQEFSPKGFTLVEVMVTLTILGFITLMIFGVFRLGLSAWAKGENIRDEYQKVRQSAQMICRQIKSALPYQIKATKAEENYLAFEGKADALKFVSTLPLKSHQTGGLVLTAYAFKRNGKEEGNLLFFERRVLNKDFMGEDIKEESWIPLLEDLSAVRFEYLRTEDLLKGREAEWMEEWNIREEKELPRAIRVTIIPKKKKEKEEETPVVILVSLPAYRLETLKPVPGRRVIPTRPPI